MSRDIRPYAELHGSCAGLRALAELINDALVAMGTQPAFAVAGSGGVRPGRVAMAIDV
ncbi:MAG: hypothetical protein QOK11_441, partial [Pseudonocardiales bacterium]|nr:hypothetical protein [Pseudonocardiales bacterium]